MYLTWIAPLNFGRKNFMITYETLFSVGCKNSVNPMPSHPYEASLSALDHWSWLLLPQRSVLTWLTKLVSSNRGQSSLWDQTPRSTPLMVCEGGIWLKLGFTSAVRVSLGEIWKEGHREPIFFCLKTVQQKWSLITYPNNIPK